MFFDQKTKTNDTWILQECDKNSAQSNSNKKFELKAAALNSKDYLDFMNNPEYKNPNCTIFP